MAHALVAELAHLAQSWPGALVVVVLVVASLALALAVLVLLWWLIVFVFGR